MTARKGCDRPAAMMIPQGFGIEPSLFLLFRKGKAANYGCLPSVLSGRHSGRHFGILIVLSKPLETGILVN